MKPDKGSTFLFTEAVLQVIGDGIRHEKRSRDFQQHRALDGLDMAPQVPVVVAEVAKPSASGPCLEFHWHLLFRSFILRTNLFQQSLERSFERGFHVDLLRDG